MQPEPLVSIIMPIYNVEDYIEKSVKSVINQSYKNIEFILVDDGSPDKSVDIAERILAENSYPYKLIKQENKGLGEARNTGIRNATGEWLFFIDSDDALIPNTIDFLVNAVSNDTDLVFGNFALVYETEIIKNHLPKIPNTEFFTKKNIQKLFLLHNKILTPWNSLYRRSVLQENNLFFSDISWSEDQHFLWRFITKIRGATYVDAVLYQYLQRNNSIMKSSKVDGIVRSYPEICRLADYYTDDDTIKQFLAPRWVMGTINSSSCFLRFKDWVYLANSLQANENMRKLKSFPNFKVKASAFVFVASKRLYYSLARFLKKGR